MSYSVNWITKVISIPTADLTLVSGTRYSLLMSSFLAEVRRLEWEFSEGLWAVSIVKHTDTRNDFAGANYAPFDDMINGYTVQITGVATRVDLLGSNNDIIDVLIPTGVSVVPSNSAGLQVYTASGGISEQDKQDIISGVWSNLTRTLTEGTKDSEIDVILDIVTDILKMTTYNVSRDGDIFTIFEADGVTVWRQYNLADRERTFV